MRIDAVKEACTGCGGCITVCPTNAITMTVDEEGFEVPVINKKKCIECGKCYKFCHAVDRKKQASEIQKAYYGRNKNANILQMSSSGGIYYSIAQNLAQKKYWIYGAIWDNDEKCAKHASNEEYDIKEQMGSKYVQSKTWAAYNKIKEQLYKGEKILFSGTPCQVAGLKRCVGNNENLITIDFICHGVPSPKILQDRIKELESKHKSNMLNLKFRSKIGKWSQHKLYTEYANKDIDIIPSSEDTFFKLFLNNYILRKSCYECQYSNIQHEADITIADFWKLLNYNSNENDEKGMSLILVNTKKGQELLKTVEKELNLKQLEWNEASYVYKTHNNYSKQNRKKFFDQYKKNGYRKAIKKVKIKKSIYSIIKSGINHVEYKIISKKLTKKNKSKNGDKNGKARKEKK